MPVRRALITATLALLAVSTPLLAASVGHAQEQPMPDALPRLDVPPHSIAEESLDAPLAPETYSLEATSGSAGSLLAETIAATGTTLAIGTLSMAWALHTNDHPFDVFVGALRPFLLAAPLLSSFVTTFVGALTGGDGDGFHSLAASAGGACVAGFVSMFAMGIAVLAIYGFQDANEAEDAARDRSARAVAMSLGGLIMGVTSAGAVIGYRASARRPRTSYAVNAAPTLDGRGAMFLLSGAL